MKSKIMTLLGLFVVGVTAAYGSQTDEPKMNGKLRVTTLSPEEIRYTGKPYSKALGAYVFNYRNYDPQIARWTTPDPSGFPDGANSYAYVRNSITTAVDPMGMRVHWVTKETQFSPNATWGRLPEATFSWAISYNSDVVSGMFGDYTGTFRDVYDHHDSVGFATWRGLDTTDFGVEQTLTLYSRNSSGVWSPNGYVVSASALENANYSDHDRDVNNTRIEPWGAETSRPTLRGLSSFLYDFLVQAGAGYQGDLFYE